MGTGIVMLDLTGMIEQFQFEGDFIGAELCGKGHINDTHVLSFLQKNGSTRRYVLQRINQYVFKRPEQVMENIERVTAHLRSKILFAGGDPERETLNLVPAMTGGTYYQDHQGEYWRAYLFIEGASTVETANNQALIYSTAWAFGNFQKMLADFPAGLLHETIPDFHHTPKRYSAFLEACESDPFHRAEHAKSEISFLKERRRDASVLIEKHFQGEIPLRVTHNDTKLNNVMIDDQTGEVVCILDLDTVMPGLVLYDFGDAVRTAAALVSEDDPGWEAAGVSLENFESLAKGYLDAAREFLTPAEANYLAFSARVITLEQALRFLTDYINGDVYYKTHRQNHNLDRARTQIKMVQDMEDHFAQMETILSRYR